jgi:hypothetical protein
MAAEVRFEQRKGRRGPASKPFRAPPNSKVWLVARPLFLRMAGTALPSLPFPSLPSGNPFPHDMAGGRPVGEKPALRVEQSAFAAGHLPTDM